jgi:hypothetical protein
LRSDKLLLGLLRCRKNPVGGGDDWTFVSLDMSPQRLLWFRRLTCEIDVQQYACAGLNFVTYHDRSPTIVYDGAAPAPWAAIRR